MSKALLITPEDLKRYSVLNGNIDSDKFIQYIAISQDIQLQQFLGTDLLEKIQLLITNDTIGDVGNADYNTLLTKYIKPMLIHWALVEYLPFSPYTIANNGVFKPNSETSVTVDKNEIDYLVEKERTIAQNYTRRFENYICDNSSKYPEYNSNSGSDVRPSKSSDFTGWVL